MTARTDKLYPDAPQQEIIQAIEDNYVAYLRGLKQSPRVVWHEDEDGLWFKSGIEASWLNRVMRFRDINDQARIQSAVDWFEGLPFQWFFGPSTDASVLRPYLMNLNMTSMGEEIGMVADLREIEATKLPHDLVIRPVTDRRTALEWSSVMNPTFGMSDEVGALYRGLELAALQHGSPRHTFVGYQAEQPVTIGTLFLHSGVAGVLTIGTIPEARRQGFGSAMTGFLLQTARGYDYYLGVLMASELGAGVYRRQGFQKVCHFYRFEDHGP